MGKHPRDYSDSEFDSESSSDAYESDDSDYSPDTKKSVPQRKPTTTAHIVSLATDVPPDKAEARERVANVGDAVLQRIRNALRLGGHENTGEHEAKQALRMATKLMEQHNVTQADIMEFETDAERLKRAGQSVVAIRSTLGADKKVNQTSWMLSLSQAMEVSFDCNSYSVDFREPPGVRLEWSFYGFAEQTVAAAYAFEMTYNLIVSWSCKPEVGIGVHNRNCYCNGIADGLYWMAEDEKELDLQRAEQKERALLEQKERHEKEEDESRLARLKGPEEPEAAAQGAATEAKTDKMESSPPQDRKPRVEEVEDQDEPKSPSKKSPSKNSTKKTPGRKKKKGRRNSSDDDKEPDEAVYYDKEKKKGATFNASDKVVIDVDAELAAADKKAREKAAAKLRADLTSKAPTSASTVINPKIEEDDESPWKSVQQLVRFRETSIAVGEEYLKAEGIKLRKGRKRAVLKFKTARAAESYGLGKEDAQTIDVKRRRIKDAGMD